MTPDQPPRYGLFESVGQGIGRVIAPNPSPMTHWGTNTFILGERSVVVIDPGPDDEAHLAALLSVIADRPVTHILVTHSHLDHSPLAKPLAQITGAPVCAFGHSDTGRSPIMQTLAEAGTVGGGEGVDKDFAPDVLLSDGEEISVSGKALTAHHTPGHFGNHMSFEWDGRLFCGDHVMGWASSLVSPPDGDLGQFLASCQKLQRLEAAVFYPAHGDAIDAPAARLDWLLKHRQSRSQQIMSLLADGPLDTSALTAAMYRDTPKALWPAAARNVLAHLIHLHELGDVRPEGPIHPDSVFIRT